MHNNFSKLVNQKLFESSKDIFTGFYPDTERIIDLLNRLISNRFNVLPDLDPEKNPNDGSIMLKYDYSPKNSEEGTTETIIVRWEPRYSKGDNKKWIVKVGAPLGKRVKTEKGLYKTIKELYKRIPRKPKKNNYETKQFD